jgi:excisionase family DNA binding protein
MTCVHLDVDPRGKPAICERDKCGGSHWHPITGAPPDSHYLSMRWQGDGTWSYCSEPRWHQVWKRGAKENWYYNPSEVARELGVQRQTVARWIKAGKIAAVTMPSGRHMIKAVDVTRFLRVTTKVAPKRKR